MRIEIARLRAKLEWEQDELLDALICFIQKYSDKLTRDSLTLACERLDDDHLLDLWKRRSDVMGQKYHRLLLKDLKRKNRRQALVKIFKRYFNGDESQQQTSPRKMMSLICKWHSYLNIDTMKNYIMKMDIQNKWVFFSKVGTPLFECLGDLILGPFFDELYKDDPQMCIENLSGEATWLVKDRELQKKYFLAKFKLISQFTNPPPSLEEDHFEWYVELLKADRIDVNCGQHYPMARYLIERPAVIRKGGRVLSATATSKIVFARIERIIELLDADLEVGFVTEDLLGSNLRKRMAKNHELDLRLWRAFCDRIRRAVQKSYASPELILSDSSWSRKNVIIRQFGRSQMTDLLKQAPAEMFEELKRMFAQFENIPQTSLDWMKSYKTQNLTWSQYLKSHIPFSEEVHQSGLQHMCEEICFFNLILKEPRRVCDIPYNWLEGTQGPNIFSCYDDLYLDVKKSFDLPSLYEFIFAEEYDETKAVEELMMAIQSLKEGDIDKASTQINKISQCADYVKKFRNDHELQAALIFLSDLIHSVHPESILTTYDNWWGSTSASPSKPYPHKQPTPEETLDFTKSIFLLDPKLIAARVEQITELPFEGPQTWIYNHTLLTQFKAQDGLSKSELAEFYISKFASVANYIDRQLTLCPTLIYVSAYFIMKYIIPTLTDLPAANRTDEINLPRIELSQLNKGLCTRHQEALNIFLLLARMWQIKIVDAEDGDEDGDEDGEEEECETKHFRRLTGLVKGKALEPWLYPTYYSRLRELYLPFNLVSMKYHQLRMPSEHSWQYESRMIKQVSPKLTRIVESLVVLLEKHELAQVIKINGIEDPKATLTELKHRKHVGSRLCRACVREFWVQSQNFTNSRCLTFMCGSGLAKPLLLEAMKCKKLHECRLMTSLRSHSKLAEQMQNHIEHVDLTSPFSAGVGAKAAVQRRRIRAVHAPCDQGSIIRHGILGTMNDWNDMSDQELYLLLEVFCVSRRASDSSSSDKKLISPAMKQLANFLQPQQVFKLTAKITPLAEHIPAMLGHRDEALETVEILRTSCIKDTQQAPVGLRALSIIIPRLPGNKVNDVLDEADDTLVRSQKMKLECLVTLHEDLLSDLCLCEPTPENIKKLKAVDDTTKVLLGGLYGNQLEVPEVFTALKRLNGVDSSSELNGSLGDGTGLQRLLKPTTAGWNLSAVARNARVRFALSLLVSENLKVVGAAMNCLSSLGIDECSNLFTTPEDDVILHNRLRPEWTYMSRRWFYTRFNDPEIICKYLEYMITKRFNPSEVNVWLYSVLGSNEDRVNDGTLASLTKKLDREVGVGQIIFDRMSWRQVERVSKFLPECAVWSED